MDSFASIGRVNWDAMMKTNDISRETQAHLSQVYAALIAGVAFSAVGVYIQFTMYLAGTLTYIATFGLLAWILFDSDKQTTPKRLALFAGFCVFEGISIGDLVRVAMLMDKAIVMTALLGTTTVFACFSIASLLSPRRSKLYLGGILSSVLSFLLIAGLINMFVRSTFLFNVQLYLGLAMFAGYVVFDTQLIVEKASNGDRDVVGHAITLFIDFVGMFVRILIILMKNKGDKKSDRK